MLRPTEWFWYVITPFLAVIGVDQASKHWAMTLAAPIRYGPLEITLQNNAGFLLGAFAKTSEIYTLVVPSTVGALLLFLFAMVQYFVPIKSPLFRSGLAIFIGGVIGNIIDRFAYGSVRDFIYLKAPWGATGVFNVADALQWVGVIAFIVSYLKHGEILYPVDERRGRKWIDSKFQLRYCVTLLGVGTFYAMLSGTLAYTFLTYAYNSLKFSSAAKQGALYAFEVVYASSTGAFFVTLLVVGIYLSHRIVGPVKSFEAFLEDLLQGRQRNFRLRRNDDFQHFEALAEKFRDHFHQSLGIDQAPLAAGMLAPDFEAMTADRKTVSLRQYLGKRVWIIFYRYATCPLCAVHLDGIRETIAQALAANVQVLVVYESNPEDFTKEAAGDTVQLLRSMQVPLIADPERKLYRAYRTRTNVAALLHPSTAIGRWRAWRKKYRQSTIDGNIGQLPAHFLISARGVVQQVHYGRHFFDHLPFEQVAAYIARGDTEPPDAPAERPKAV